MTFLILSAFKIFVAEVQRPLQQEQAFATGCLVSRTMVHYASKAHRRSVRSLLRALSRLMVYFASPTCHFNCEAHISQ